MDDNTFWFLIWWIVSPLGWFGSIFAGIGFFLTFLGLGMLVQGFRGTLNVTEVQDVFVKSANKVRRKPVTIYGEKE